MTTTNEPTGRRSAVIHAAYHGLPVDLTLEGAPLDQVERLIDGLLRRDGWAAPATNGSRQARKPSEPPLYSDDGTPCCPWHRKPLREGRYGLYCPSKAEGEQANGKGYCCYSFKSE